MITKRERFLMRAAMKVANDYSPEDLDKWLSESICDAGLDVEDLLHYEAKLNDAGIVE